MPDPLAFSIDLESVRARVMALGYFLSVTDIQAAAQALEDGVGVPPAAYVSVASETAEPSKIIGGHSQRVTARVSVLYCIPAQRAADDLADVIDQAKRAVIRQLIGWTPDGAERKFDYDRYQIRAMQDGLIWCEALFVTTYRIDV